MSLHAADCAGSKNPFRPLFSFSKGLYGRVISFPACMARVHIRFRKTRSRLMVAFDAPAFWRMLRVSVVGTFWLTFCQSRNQSGLADGVLGRDSSSRLTRTY
jgi:hypothetical protein